MNHRLWFLVSFLFFPFHLIERVFFWSFPPLPSFPFYPYPLSPYLLFLFLLFSFPFSCFTSLSIIFENVLLLVDWVNLKLLEMPGTCHGTCVWLPSVWYKSGDSLQSGYNFCSAKVRGNTSTYSANCHSFWINIMGPTSKCDGYLWWITFIVSDLQWINVWSLKS